MATKSLFKKVNEIISFNKQTGEEPLWASLIIYQKAKEGLDTLQSFLGQITCLESLITEAGETKYKFQIRTSVLVETESKKRFDLYKELGKIYDLRSSFVHGSKTTTNLWGDLEKTKRKLAAISRIVLLKYIDFIYTEKEKIQKKGESKILKKKTFIDHVDQLVLGFN